MTSLNALLKHSLINKIDHSKLDLYELAYLKAKTLREEDAIITLSRVVIASLPTGVHSQRGIQKLIRIYLGQGISFVSVRTDLRCTNSQVEVYQEAVRVAMDEVRNRLSAALKVALEEVQ